MIVATAERYSSTIPWRKNSDAPVRHFVQIMEQPEGVKRDRFGNSVIVSHTKSYLDRGGNETRASLLVSREGDMFFDQNPGIIDDIETGVYVLTNAAPNRELDLGNNRKMKKMRSHAHAQSKLFLLETNDKKYMIKIPTPADGRYKNFRQPYINEMIQTQSLAVDLHEELDHAQIEMPAYLFASGHMSCTEYVEGTSPSTNYLLQKIEPISYKIEDYIRSQQSDLWSNIGQDAYTRIGSRLELLRTDNFVKRTDGTLVWVDPFKYDDAPVSFSDLSLLS